MAWSIERTDDTEFPYLIHDEKGELVAKIAMATKTKIQETGGFTKATGYKEEDRLTTEARARSIALVPELEDFVAEGRRLARVSAKVLDLVEPAQDLLKPEWVKAAENTIED